MKRPAALPTAALSLALSLNALVAAPPALAQSSASTGAAAEFPHDSFGAPARVLTTRHDSGIGATIVTFSTGARLIVKQTHFTPGQVSVVASFGAGRAGAPADLVHALWATTLFPIGGTRHLSYDGLDAWQQSSGHPVNVTLVPGVGAFRLQGAIPSNDLDPELTLLTAYAREPGFRDDMVAKIASVGAMLEGQVEGDPAMRFTRAVQRRLVGRRYQELPEQADLAATTGTEMQALLGPAFAMAPDIAIVGDIDADVAIRAVATTLAAGDPRPVLRRGIAAAPMPTNGPLQRPVLDTGATAERRLGFYWRLPDIRTAPRIERAARVAAAMIEARLATSTMLASSAASPAVARAVVPPDFKGGGYFGVVIRDGAVPLDGTRALLAGTINDLAARRFTAAELDHARQSVAAEIGADGMSNEWWAQRLSLALRDPAMGQAVRIEAGVVDVDRTEVVACIRRYLAGRVPLIVVADAREAGETMGGSR